MTTVSSNSVNSDIAVSTTSGTVNKVISSPLTEEITVSSANGNLKILKTDTPDDITVGSENNLTYLVTEKLTEQEISAGLYKGPKGDDGASAIFRDIQDSRVNCIRSVSFLNTPVRYANLYDNNGDEYEFKINYILKNIVTGDEYSEGILIGVEKGVQVTNAWLKKEDYDNGIDYVSLTINGIIIKFIFDLTLATALSYDWSSGGPIATLNVPELTIQEYDFKTDHPDLVKIQAEKNAVSNHVGIEPFAGLDEAIINPDNIVGKLNYRVPSILDLAPNLKVFEGEDTHLNMQIRETWGTYETAKDVYAFSTVLDPYFQDCIDYGFRLTFRFPIFNGFTYDPVEITDGTTFKIGFPEYLYDEMKVEGKTPNTTATGVEPDYTSDILVTRHNAFLTALYSYLNSNITHSSTTILRKNLVEYVQLGHFGIYGEGWIENFPTDVTNLNALTDQYPTIFTDIQLIAPGATLKHSFDVGLDRADVESVIDNLHDVSNTVGDVGLFIDLTTVYLEQYLYFKTSKISYKDESTFDYLQDKFFGKRMVCGEGGQNTVPGATNILFSTMDWIYEHRAYGLSMGNTTKTGTPFIENMFNTLVSLTGARLVINSATVDSSTETLNLDFQNMGLSKVYSQNWEARVFYYNESGTVISNELLSLDVTDLDINEDYEEAGLIDPQDPTSYNLTIPAGTEKVYFAIVDKHDIYPNYNLSNYGRNANGHYLVHTMYGDELIPGGQFNTGDLALFDVVGGAYSINGSDQLVCVATGGYDGLYVDFEHTVGDFYKVSYDIISSDLDGTMVLSATGGFGSQTLAHTAGSHEYDFEFTNASPANDFRFLVINDNTPGKTLVMDNLSVRKIIGSVENISTRGDIRYYTDIELDGGQLDNRYYTETEVDGMIPSIPTNHLVDDADDSTSGRLTAAGFTASIGGRIKSTTRVITTYTILVTDSVVFANSDAGDYTVTLPAGVEGQTIRVINSGSSANTITVDGDGTDTIYSSLTFALEDNESIEITYNADDGWM